MSCLYTCTCTVITHSISLCVPLRNCYHILATDQPPMDNSWVIIGCAVGGGMVALLVVVFAIAWLIWAARKSVSSPSVQNRPEIETSKERVKVK